MTSNISLSLPCHDSIVPPLSDMAIVSHPSNQNSSKRVLKFHLKLNPNHISSPKVADSTVINGSKTSPTSSYQKSLKIKGTEPSDAGPIIAGEINATKPKTHACKEESLLVVDYQPTQAYIDEPAVANKNQKK
ncbi:hypothetical protein V6N13_148432 [Hibiscus sabdariffa]